MSLYDPANGVFDGRHYEITRFRALGRPRSEGCEVVDATPGSEPVQVLEQYGTGRLAQDHAEHDIQALRAFAASRTDAPEASS